MANLKSQPPCIPQWRSHEVDRQFKPLEAGVYHVIFILKGLHKALFDQVRRNLGEVFHRLAEQNESEAEEEHLIPNPVHMMLLIPRSALWFRW